MPRSGTPHTIVSFFLGCFLAIPLAAARSGGAMPHEESLANLRSQFLQQTDPVRRAKVFPKYGDALMAEMRKQEAAREYDQVAPLFVEYRDAASATYAGLSADGRDAEKHPNGFRE